MFQKRCSRWNVTSEEDQNVLTLVLFTNNHGSAIDLDIFPTFTRNWWSLVLRPMSKRNWRLGAALIDLLLIVNVAWRVGVVLIPWRSNSELTLHWRVDFILLLCRVDVVLLLWLSNSVLTLYWHAAVTCFRCIWGVDVTMMHWRCIWCTDVKSLTDVGFVLLPLKWRRHYNDALTRWCKLTSLLQ